MHIQPPNGQFNTFDFLFYRCVVAELFSEGTRLFDLSELLAYRNGTYNPNNSISEKIEDEHIRVTVVC